MFGKMGDMLGKLQEMKQKADEIKTKLDGIVLKIEGAGGDIKIEITGNKKVKNVFVAPALQHGGKDELEEQLTVTINKAIETADKLNEEEMKKAAGGLLPGM
ncbi:MAG: YbaB/EbfC family nucleoid-associated protein [Bacteroidia bacterium]|nr:YbaB/EbfC family nucleoid-associated protein [Bacteroidia bacterium]